MYQHGPLRKSGSPTTELLRAFTWQHESVASLLKVPITVGLRIRNADLIVTALDVSQLRELTGCTAFVNETLSSNVFHDTFVAQTVGFVDTHV